MGVRLPPLAPQPSGTGQDSEITRPSGDTRTTDSDLIREAREISAATRIGLYWNLILGALKFAAGLLVGSLALLADGFNSVADVLTDLALIVGARMAARPPDRSHPFGHGKIETFVAGGVDIGVIVVGAGIVWSAVEALMGGSKSPIDGVPVVFVSAGTIVVKEWLFRRTRLVAARCRSAALQGKAWDHRADVAVSSVVLAGGVGTIAGWSNADAVAGIVVGGVVFSVGVKLLFEILVELSEGSAGAAVEARIDAILKEIPEIRGWHRLRIRRIGRELLMDVHIMLDASLTIEAGHHIVRRIERTLSEGMDWPLHTVIHIDPDNEEIRNKRRALGDTTLRGTG